MGARRRLLPLAALSLFAAATFGAGSLHAWGFTAHRLVNRKAIGALPPELRAFFQPDAAYVAEHSIDPDLARSGASDPNHFLNLDAFGDYPFPDVGTNEAAHLARFGRDAPGKGRVHWRVGELYTELVAAFRAKEARRSLETAAALGHFIADAHVPFHATLNYDGQLTGQRGLHARWESMLVERDEARLENAVQPAAATLIADPVAFTLETLRESFLRYGEALASDRDAVAGLRDLAETPEDERYQDFYYARLQAREHARVESRLARAAWATASLWTSAWTEAGRPEMPAGPHFPYVRHGARAILLSLDGGGAQLLGEAMKAGTMPNLAALRTRGAQARGSISTLPSKTATAHAALFTGAWSGRTGVFGNEIPRPGGSVLEGTTGYSSTTLTAEPLWVTAARQDLDVTVVSATQVSPFSTYTDDRRFPGFLGRRLTLFDGYQNTEAPDRVYHKADLHPREPGVWLGELPPHDGPVWEIAASFDGVSIRGLVYDDPKDPVAGFDTVYLGLDGDTIDGIALKPHPTRTDESAFGSLPIRVSGTEAALFFRLFELTPEGDRILLYRAAPHVLRSNKPRLETAAFEAAGGFVGNGASTPYQNGDLGPTLWQGGDGTAERRYLETVALAVRQMQRLTDFALERCAWDLLFTYLPFPDESLHIWYGHLDHTLPTHDPALAAKVRPHYERVLRLVDEFVGHLSTRAAGDVILAVASDHGMAGTYRLIKPNIALEKASLLARDVTGQPDLARTRAVYSWGQYVRINRKSLFGGLVGPAEEAGVKREVTRALTGLKDPATGKAVILGVYPPPENMQPRDGRHAGDLFLSVAPGYGVSAAYKGAVVEAMIPRGDHFLDPERPAMHGSFVIAGPGVAQGADLGVIRIVDIAPTLAALLGIDPPAHAEGRVLEKALAHR